MSDLTEEIKQRVKSRAGHDQCVEEIERLQRALAESEKEKQETNQALDLDLRQLAHICTCKRPTKLLPGGGVEAPGDHTANCVSVIAVHALSLLSLAKSENPPSSGKPETPSDDVQATGQITISLHSFPDAEGFWLLVGDARPHLYAKLLWVRCFGGEWRQREKAGGWWTCRKGCWFQLPLDQLSRIVLSEHRGSSPVTSVPASPPPVPSESEKDTERLDWLRSGRGNWHWSVRCVKRDAETGEITVLNGDRLNAEIDSAMSSAPTVDSLSELRVKVAELTGEWEVIVFPDLRYAIERKDWPWKLHFGAKVIGWEHAPKVTDLTGLPNWPSDLNACAELEKSLTDKERFHYLACLTVLLGYDRTLYSSREFGEFSWAIRNARADQLCRAFVKTRETSVAKHADSVPNGSESDSAPVQSDTSSLSPLEESP